MRSHLTARHVGRRFVPCGPVIGWCLFSQCGLLSQLTEMLAAMSGAGAGRPLRRLTLLGPETRRHAGQSRQAETVAGEEATLALVNVGMNNKAADLQMDQSFQSLHWSMPDFDPTIRAQC